MPRRLRLLRRRRQRPKSGQRAEGPAERSAFAERAHDQILEGEVAAFADSGHEQVIVVADQPERAAGSQNGPGMWSMESQVGP